MKAGQVDEDFNFFKESALRRTQGRSDKFHCTIHEIITEILVILIILRQKRY